MSELTDLRALALGHDPILVEAAGGEYCLLEGAHAQAVGIKASKLAKDAKDHMKEAKKMAKYDKKGAMKEYDLAIVKYKELRKECDKIEDDHIVMVFLEGVIKIAVPIIAGFIIDFAIGVASTVKATTAAVASAQEQAFGSIFGDYADFDPEPISVAFHMVESAGASEMIVMNEAVGTFTMVGAILGLVWGLNKPVRFMVNANKNGYGYNQQGANGKEDVSKWYKLGMTRANTMAAFDRMIKVCEKSKAKLEKSM